MKEWQKGYELEYLKKITNYFSDYNEFSCSPFSEMNPNTVATALEKGHLEYLLRCIYSWYWLGNLFIFYPLSFYKFFNVSSSF